MRWQQQPSPVIRTNSSRFPRKVAHVIQPASIAVSQDWAQQTSWCLRGSIICLEATYRRICAIRYSPDESAIDDAPCIPPPTSLSPSLFLQGKRLSDGTAIPRLVGGTAWKMSPSGGELLLQASAHRCSPTSCRSPRRPGATPLAPTCRSRRGLQVRRVQMFGALEDILWKRGWGWWD